MADALTWGVLLWYGPLTAGLMSSGQVHAGIDDGQANVCCEELRPLLWQRALRCSLPSAESTYLSMCTPSRRHRLARTRFRRR